MRFLLFCVKKTTQKLTLANLDLQKKMQTRAVVMVISAKEAKAGTTVNRVLHSENVKRLILCDIFAIV